MDFKGPQDYSIICWSGDFDDKNLLIHTVVEGNAFENLDFHRYSSVEVVNERGKEKVVDVFAFICFIAPYLVCIKSLKMIKYLTQCLKEFQVILMRSILSVVELK